MAAGCATRIADTLRGERCVVLLHGYLESLDIWEDFVKLLAPSMRVLMIDLPGHGVSQVMGEIHTMEFEADAVASAMDAAGVDRAVIVGHSMGGYVALNLLDRHPDRVAGIALLHSRPDADSDEKRLARQEEIDLVLNGCKDVLETRQPQVGFAPDNRRRMASHIADMATQIAMTDDDGIVALQRGMAARSDMNDILRRSQVPQLMIFGCKDEYIPVEKARETIAAQPQAQVVWMENSGHNSFLEEPERCAQTISEFVDKVMAPVAD